MIKAEMFLRKMTRVQAPKPLASQLRGMTTEIFDEKERGDENRFFRQAEAEAIALMKREREKERELADAGKTATKESTAPASEKPPGRTAKEVSCSS